MTKGPLTDAAVRKLRGGPKRREVRDTGCPGLFLVIQPNGSKSWALRYRRPDGRPAKLTLGPVDFSHREHKGEPVISTPLSLAAARALAAEQHRQRKAGVDVAAKHVAEKRQKAQTTKDAAANTFAALARRFIDDHARPKTRRWKDTARLLGLDYQDGGEPQVIKGGLAARWHDRNVAVIDGGDLYGVVDEARRLGIPGLERRRGGGSDTQGRAMAAALSKLFSWLVEHRRITTNPAIGMYKPPAPNARERELSEAEIRWFWQACEKLGEPFGALLRLLLITGCRRNEVAHMTAGELDGNVWTIPGMRTKNHRPHVVYLPPLAQELLPKDLPAPAAYVFSTNGGTTPVSGWSKIKRRLDAAMLEAAQKEVPAASIAPWRLHDLRRTAVTQMNRIGVLPHVVEAVVNHISGHKGGVAGIYNKSELKAEKTAALERWAVHIDGIVSDKPTNVVAMRPVA
jgi:integrase